MPFPGRTDGSEADAFIPSDRSFEHNVRLTRLAVRLAYVSVEMVLEKKEQNHRRIAILLRSTGCWFGVAVSVLTKK